MRKNERNILEKAHAILTRQCEDLKIKAENGNKRCKSLLADCKDAQGALYDYLYSCDHLDKNGMIN